MNPWSCESCRNEEGECERPHACHINRERMIIAAEYVFDPDVSDNGARKPDRE
jgi:hypothetical protein